MWYRESVETILEEIREVLKQVRSDEVGDLLKALRGASKVYVSGQGRSGILSRTFAMRLMHLGLTAYVVGETVTPAMEPGDLLVACSGSGESRLTCYLAEVAAKVGAKVVAVTATRDSRLARMADTCVVIPAKRGANALVGSSQFGGTLFEQTMLLLFDAVVLHLQREMNRTPDEMSRLHTNLE
jgi:6-phospho-3-hexuloisomerase